MLTTNYDNLLIN